MALKKPKLISAKNYMITAESENKTRFTQNQRTGQMTGRTTKGKGNDGTKNIRFTRDIDIDGKPGIGEQDIRAGQVGGRLKKGESKPIRIEVTNHYRNGKFIGHHMRKVH